MTMLFFLKPVWRPGGDEWYKPRPKRTRQKVEIETLEVPDPKPQNEQRATVNYERSFKDALLLLEEIRRIKEQINAITERVRLERILKELRDKEEQLKIEKIRAKILQMLTRAIEKEARDWQDQKDLQDILALNDLMDMGARV